MIPTTKNTETKLSLNEGIAKALSQGCMYPLEMRKTLIQIHGKVPAIIKKRGGGGLQLCNGLLTSCLTSGLVWNLYFNIYNNLNTSPFAGSIASFMTSIIKLPIGNSMRIMQSGTCQNIFSAGKKLYITKGIRGIYNGYALNVIEDAIDIDLRMRLFNHMQKYSKVEEMNPLLSVGYGALTGTIVCGIMTPFDTLRTKLCFETASHLGNQNAIKLAKNILLAEGVGGFYKGASLRITSNALKTALFFGFLNLFKLL